MTQIVDTPKPPYYAVIFTSLHGTDLEGYRQIASEMIELATQQPGYLGMESARDELGVTVSYWSDLASIKNWKANVQHLTAQKLGREKWYSAYKTRIAKVEKEYGYEN